MKRQLLLFLILAAWCVPHGMAQAPAGNPDTEAAARAAFFARHPDLADEAETVAAAAAALATEPRIPSEGMAAEEALAARTRWLLARRSPQEWQRKAISLFPELGVEGSKFNALFLKHYQEMKRNSPQFLEEPSWPVLLARRCADELRGTVAPSRPAGPAPAAANTLPEASPPGQLTPAPLPTRAPTPLWRSTLSLLLLLALIGSSGRWLLRRAARFEAARGTAWQRALRPAAWACLAIGLLGLGRTFYINADLGAGDRFGITLLVSLLSAVCAAPPAFFIAWAWAVWQARAPHRAGTRPA